MANEKQERLLDELNGLLNDVADADAQRTIQDAINTIETQDTLLTAMNEFVEQPENRGDFEEGLDYETQELYREHFDLNSDRDSDDELSFADR